MTLDVKKREITTIGRGPLGARKTLLIETNSHAVKRLKSEVPPSAGGFPQTPITEEIET